MLVAAFCTDHPQMETHLAVLQWGKDELKDELHTMRAYNGVSLGD